MPERPNLFSYATSELSQDAFLSWILAWASPCHQESDPVLHRTVVKLLDTVFHLCGESLPTIVSLKIERQFQGLDVLVLVNDGHAVLIEDKTNTREHGNQLARYLDEVRKRWPERRQIPIYFKTTEQSSYQAVE